MNMAQIEFSRRYAMAHRLLADPQSKCAAPHGHNEMVTVRLAPERGFRFGGANAAAPFDALKRRWHAWIDGHVDHALQLGETDPLIGYFRAHEPHLIPRLLTVHGDPTTEALAACFWLKLSAFLRADELPFSVAAVRVEETPTNAVVLDAASFDPAAAALAPGAWPSRADMSINDL